MTYQRKQIRISDRKIQVYIDNLMACGYTELPPKIAQDLGRNKTIRAIRDSDRKNPYITIGHDRKFGISMIHIRTPMKIRKNGDKYDFFL
jgi:hypothetical protein